MDIDFKRPGAGALSLVLLLLLFHLFLAACQSAPPAASEDESGATAASEEEPPAAPAPAEQDVEEVDAEEQEIAETESQEAVPDEAPGEEGPAQDETQADPPAEPETENDDPPDESSDELSEEERDILSDDDPCLYDTWVVDNDHYLSFYSDLALAQGAESSPFTAIEGTLAVSLSESLEWTVDSDLTVTLEGGLTSDIQHRGAGIYLINEGALLFEGDTETTAAFAGRTDSVMGSGDEVGWVPYTCDEETMTLGALLYHREG